MSDIIKEPMIKPKDLEARWNVSSETIRRYRKKGILPPFDYEYSRKNRGWNESTIIAAGRKL